MNKISVSVLMFLMLTLSTFAASEVYFRQTGGNTDGQNFGDWYADYDLVNSISYSVAITQRYVTDGDAPAVIGELDGDAYPELVYDNNGDIQVISMSENGLPEIEYFENTDIVSPMALFDGDGDGLDEIYFCGNNVTGGGQFMSYEVESGSLDLKWRQHVGNFNATDGGATEQFSCGMIFVGSTVDSIDGIYTPVCSDNYGGDPACFYVGPRSTGVSTNKDTRPSLYRYNASNGAVNALYLPGIDFSGDSDNCRWSGVISSLAGASVTISGIAQMNGNSRVSTPVTCDLDSDGKDELQFLVHCQHPSTTAYYAGWMSVNLDTMTMNTAFDSNGYSGGFGSDSVFSSPVCVDTGGQKELLYATIAGGTDNVYLNHMLGDGALFTYGIGQIGDATAITNPFFAEANGDSYPDMCVVGSGTGTTLICNNVLGILPDAVDYDMTVATAVTPCVSSTSYDDAGIGPSNLAGDLNSDFFSSATGIMMIDPVNESATKAAYSVPPTDARTCVSAGDVNLDGFTDIVSINDLYMRLYISNATSGNEQVDLKRVIPDVSGSTMCGGTNQSFFIEPPMTGYTDLESNIVRALFRCDLAGNLSNTSWTPYGTDFTLPCYYGVNSTGSHIAMICMQDIVHASDLSQCVNIETIVSNGELCVSPDLIFSEDNAVTDIEEGDADGDGIPDSEDSATLKEKLEGIFSLMDADDEDSRLIVCIAIIVVTMLGFIAMSHGHTLASLVAGFACGMIELITFTLLGWVTPFILVALVIVLVAVGFIVIPLVRGSGG